MSVLYFVYLFQEENRYCLLERGPDDFRCVVGTSVEKGRSAGGLSLGGLERGCGVTRSNGASLDEGVLERKPRGADHSARVPRLMGDHPLLVEQPTDFSTATLLREERFSERVAETSRQEPVGRNAHP